MESTAVGIGAVVVIALYQIWVTFQIIRSAIYEPPQKWLQVALIWLIPLIGAVVAHSMLRSEGKPPYKPEKGYTEPEDRGS